MSPSTVPIIKPVELPGEQEDLLIASCQMRAVTAQLFGTLDKYTQAPRGTVWIETLPSLSPLAMACPHGLKVMFASCVAFVLMIGPRAKSGKAWVDTIMFMVRASG